MSDKSDNVISMLDRAVQLAIQKTQIDHPFEHGDRVSVARAVCAFEELLLDQEFAFIRYTGRRDLVEICNDDMIVVIRPEALERCDQP